jgi:hypothetical protein
VKQEELLARINADQYGSERMKQRIWTLDRKRRSNSVSGPAEESAPARPEQAGFCSHPRSLPCIRVVRVEKSLSI